MDIFQGWGVEIARGLMTTVEVALLSLVVGLVWGILGALAQLSSNGALRALGRGFTLVVRGTPELLIILIAYFGGTIALTGLARMIDPGVRYLEVPALPAGVFALSLVFGGYAAEVLRGAYLAIPKGEIEAADAFGMSAATSLIHIRLPLMWRYALPGLGNNWISLIKDTSLISIVGLEELMRISTMATQVNGEPFRFYLVAALIYLLLTTLNTSVVDALERRAARGERKLAR
ncbi:ABC transporter permease subunit [Mesorhizobium sp. BR1-1-9]|uniref:ABC transporter permease n=1 Tax=Mesorhizobium sp. BR1-1-9 TaxID=2876646 RepID=UPI001CD060B5|nr:ABC transporter permease subunit [Mesorhizobium sp. BR1-1-9]MBZ9870331.1 ABC transporter permease subunit [Mesorhizobium sp. BR1-1-9]